MVWALIQFSRRLNWPFLQLLTDIQFSKISRSVSCPTLCYPRLPCPSLSPRICSISCPLNQWCHPAISSCPQSFSASGSFPMSQLFASDGWSIGASASASVHAMHIQGWFPVGLTGFSRDSQESSLAPQFKSINSLALSLLYGLALTSIQDYWKNHSFDYLDLCQQSDVSAF